MIILVISMLMIYPDYRTMATLDKNIQQLNAKLETQKLLFPVFQKMLTEIDLKLPEGVSIVKEEKLSQEQAAGIVPVFYELAGRFEVKVVEASPDMDSTLNGSGLLLMNIVAAGDFFKLREFLITLESLPYLEKIEQIKLQDVDGDKHVRLKIWLAKETKGK